MTTLRGLVRHPLVAGSVALLGARVVSMIAGLATVSIVVRSLDRPSFGFWSALVSLTTLTAGLDLGIGNSVRNRIAILRAAGDEAGASETFGAALIAVAVLSVAFGSLVLVAAAGMRASGLAEWSGEQQRAIAVAVVFLGAFQVGNVAQLALYAREQPALVAAIEVVRWVVTVGALLLTAHTGGGLVTMTGVYFMALALSVSVALPILLRDHRWRRRLPGPGSAWRILRREAWSGAGFAALQMASSLVYQTDVLIAAQLTTLGPAGDFALVQRLYLVPLSLLFAAITPFWSRTATEVARGNQGWARSLATSAAAVTAGGLAAGGVFLVSLGPWAVEIWAGRAVHDRRLYVGLAVWMVVAGWVAVLSVVLNGMGRLWSQVRWLLVAFVAKLLVAGLLVERLGIAALAWGAAFSLLPLAVSNWHEVRRSMGAGMR